MVRVQHLDSGTEAIAGEEGVGASAVNASLRLQFKRRGDNSPHMRGNRHVNGTVSSSAYLRRQATLLAIRQQFPARDRQGPS